MSWDTHLPLHLDISAPGSQAFAPGLRPCPPTHPRQVPRPSGLNCNCGNSFPEPPACRWQMVGLLSLYNWVSQSLVLTLLLRFYIMQETQESWVQSPGQEDPLEKGMVTHSSILSWRIPWREEPGKLQSMGSQESDMTEHVHRARNRSVQFSRSVVSDSL